MIDDMEKKAERYITDLVKFDLDLLQSCDKLLPINYKEDDDIGLM